MLANSLKKGDIIGIVVPSGPMEEKHKEFFYNAKGYFENLGFRILFSKNLFNKDKWGYSSAEPKEKANDINEMFANPEVKAIWCLRGGKTANQCLDFLDFDLIKKNPKIFMGKSDIDLLSMAINSKTDLITFHCPDFYIGMGKDMDFDYSKRWFEKRLVNREIGEVEKATEWEIIREGQVEGKIIGCCLTSMLKLLGTKWSPDFKDSILFLEDYSVRIRESLSFLTQLKHLGVLDNIKGIVIGYIFGLQDEEMFKKNPQYDVKGNKVNFEDIVLEITKDFDFPILKVNEFGHYNVNCFLPIGAKVKLDATNKKIEIIEKCLK